MSAVITEPIGPQSFEIIRDRLAEFINIELQNQIAMQYLTEFDNIQVFLESWVPRDNGADMPCVCINLLQGDFDNMKPLDLNGNYLYSVDCYTAANAEDDTVGDDVAAFRLHRLLGLVRAIVMNPAYKTLGFEPGFISRVQIDTMPIIEPMAADANNIIRGRLVVKVSALEQVSPQNIRLSTGHTTKLELGTGVGYKYEYNT